MTIYDDGMPANRDNLGIAETVTYPEGVPVDDGSGASRHTDDGLQLQTFGGFLLRITNAPSGRRLGGVQGEGRRGNG